MSVAVRGHWDETACPDGGPNPIWQQLMGALERLGRRELVVRWERAGRLIEECGLKGHVHGAAGIFHKHANIIVNFGGATAAEVRTLIDLAQETVAQKTGHELVPEVSFVGEF